MVDVAIRAEGLSKKYRIGSSIFRYGRLTESITNAVTAPFRRIRGSGNGQVAEDRRHIWALKDVSFDVRRGEALGIIGRNGAGKTTLLKILARITDPTEGRAELYGRVGALLEVGTGFHPELTGRENIMLNGAILGMRRKEIARKLDDIVAFAEIEPFIDTPAKRYSAGMYVRLAFSVAAHLEPDILVVDEVLAVGDTEFQRKCLSRLDDVTQGGRTVLFVSHNLGAVNRLCDRAVWLDKGQIRQVGPAQDVVSRYLESGDHAMAEVAWPDFDQPESEGVRLRRVSITSDEGRATAAIDIRKPFYVELEYELLRPIRNFALGFGLLAGDGTIVFTARDRHGLSADTIPVTRDAGTYVSRCCIPGHFLNEGRYTINFGAGIPNVRVLLSQDHVLSFDVVQTGGVAGGNMGRWPGVTLPALNWEIQRLGGRPGPTPA